MRVRHLHHLNTERRALAIKLLLLSHLRDYAARLEMVGTDIACNEHHLDRRPIGVCRYLILLGGSPCRIVRVSHSSSC